MKVGLELSTILSILGALLFLSLIVTIHELGHFLVGRRLGFTIIEFAVGMGPVLLKTERNGIQYSLRALPIGGMCRFYGEDENPTDPRCFHAQKAWKRFCVIAAGPVMNLLCAILLSIITLAAYGNYVPAVLEVSGTDTPAYRAGLQEGDILCAINGKQIVYFSEAVPMIRDADSERAVMTVERDGQKIDLQLTDLYDPAVGHNRLGVTIGQERKLYTFGESLGGSFHYVWGIVRETFSFFGTLFDGTAKSTDVAGPVGTVAYISEAIRYGLEIILRFAIIISVSLGIFNLLPIPALDGGRLLFILIELVRGKPINPDKEGLVHFIGLLALFALMIFLTYNDIVNLIRG